MQISMCQITMIQEIIIFKRPKIETSWKYDQIMTMTIATITQIYKNNTNRKVKFKLMRTEATSI